MSFCEVVGCNPEAMMKRMQSQGTSHEGKPECKHSPDKTLRFAIENKTWKAVVPLAQELLESESYVWSEKKLNAVTSVLVDKHVPPDVKSCVLAEISTEMKDDDWQVLLERVCTNKCWGIVSEILKHGGNKKDAILYAVSSVISSI